MFASNRVQITDSIINHYLSVNQLLNKNSNDNSDSVTVKFGSIQSNFKSGDTVLIHQVYSNRKPTNDDYLTTGQIFFNAPNDYVGRFEFLKIKEIVHDSIIVFTKNLTKYRDSTYNSKLKLQLIKVPVYNNAEVVNRITSKKWDGNTGGILALIVNDTLWLNNNLDVTGKGFRGANATHIGTKPACITTNPNLLSYPYISQKDSIRAGRKGEGFLFFRGDTIRGRGGWGNSGSGGNGFGAGGSGGNSMFNKSGSAGGEFDSCSNRDLVNHIAKNTFTFNRGLDTLPKIIFGGGGGSSVSYGNLIATNGGNGGGAIIIMADYLVGNSKSIIANGASVTETATSGAGGGGGGGSIFLDVDTFVGSVNIFAKGGRGGNTLYNSGPGGGGASGILYYNRAVKPVELITKLNNNEYVTGGDAGIVINKPTPESNTNNASIGEAKITEIKYYSSPLNGFIINNILPDQDICYGEKPNQIIGLKVKGTSEVYYQWMVSSDNVIWDTIPGATDISYSPGPLTDTMYYRRKVKYKSFIGGDAFLYDLSNYVTINVLSKISNNVFNNPDTIVCNNFPTGKVRGLVPKNGNNQTYSYRWIYSFDSIQWKDTLVNNVNFDGLKAKAPNMWIRRVAYSGACTDTSIDYVKYNVLPSIANNIILDSSWVAPLENDTLKGNWVQKGLSYRLRGTVPNGGDKTYSYKWLKSNENKIYSEGSTKSPLLSGLNTNNLMDTIWFKRIVYSGPSDCCVDTSAPSRLNVLDSIRNNIVFGNDTICQYSSPSNFTDNGQLTGGDQKFRFIWQKKSLISSVWNSIDTVYNKVYNPGNLDQSYFFRRIALSGPIDACRDTSEYILVDTVTAISNNIVIKDTSTICQYTTLGQIKSTNPILPRKLDSVYWEMSYDSLKWQLIPSTYGKSNIFIDTLQTQRFFRRIVFSDLCKNNSPGLKINVVAPISNNDPIKLKPVCYADTTPVISATDPLGGNGIYRYQWLTKSGNEVWQKKDTVALQSGIKVFDQTIYKRVVYSGPYNCCRDTSANDTVQVLLLPVVQLSNLNDSICVNQEKKLKVAISSGKKPYQVTYSINNTQEQTVFNTDSVFFISASHPQQTVYEYKIVKAVDSNLCKAQSINGEVTLTVFDKPTPNAGIDTSYCGLFGQLSAVPYNLGINYWSSQNGIKFSPDSFQSNALVEIMDNMYGANELYWNTRLGSCKATDTLKVHFFEPTRKPNTQNDFGAPFIFDTIINAIAPPYGYAFWKSDNNEVVFQDSTNFSTEVYGLKFGKNIFSWIVKNGNCPESIDTLIVWVKDIFIPEGFSPNGDGINDRFEIYGLWNVTNANLTVYNQWGKVVYSSGNYQNEWNGTSDGTELPEDTYFYTLNVIGRTYKGFVVIKR